MGVPAFFRWLSRKYPSVVTECIEERSRDYDGNEIEIDSSQPNPNGVEFDNLYLDMNGIIHPCTHPEDKPAPKNEDEMMIAIFEAIDRLFRIVRPRKLLYMAIDGVAPRAKMNQQRSRRFRASKETNEKIHEIARIKAELRARGVDLPEVRVDEEHFDSNCITPGTPFMARLSTCLHYYIYDRLNNDSGWRNIKIILSDANVPGEGEHKIMDYVRKQRAQPDHDPNTRHCLCGADADLIMLGLATHEVNFTIIREEFKPNKPRPCSICGRIGHDYQDCTGEEQDYEEPGPPPGEVNFIFVRLNVLREYLKRDLAMPNLPFEYDFERAVDDWVFMCFFVGNDFLPHLPSLEIREGAIDRLIRLYKNCVYKTKGFLTENGNVNLEKVQIILSELGKVEDEIFKQRQINEKRFRAQHKAKKPRRNAPDFSLLENTQFAPKTVNNVAPVVNARQEAYEIRKAGMQKVGFEKFLVESGLDSNNFDTKAGNQHVKRKYVEIGSTKCSEDSDEDDGPPDEVRLWEDGFKDRYYESKFDVGKNNIEFRFEVARQYVRGLCWVMKYYYQGCCSWEWYFPYHYAPFASDFFDVGSVDVRFPYDTKPFNPLEQLMSVFPPASCSHIPEPWRCLMLNKESPIIDFYPDDFKIDLNGKKFAWQGVALLPFVEEKRLFAALKSLYEYLTPAERKRNELGSDRLYIGMNHSSFPFVSGLYDRQIDSNVETRISIDGIQGTILLSDVNVKIGGILQSPIKGLNVLCENKVLCVRYYNNKYDVDFVFQANRLKGAIAPPDVLKPSDLNASQSRNWRPQIGMAPATQRAYISDAGHRMLNFQALHMNQNDNSNRYQHDRDRNSNNPHYNRSSNYSSNNNNNNNGRNDHFNNSSSSSFNSSQNYSYRSSYGSSSRSSSGSSSPANRSYGSMNNSYNNYNEQFDSRYYDNVQNKYRNHWPSQPLPFVTHLPPNSQYKWSPNQQQRRNNQNYNNNNYHNRY